MTGFSPDAVWLGPAIEALAAIVTSAAPVEYKIRSACRAMVDHVNSLGVWILGWPPGEDESIKPQVLGFECDDEDLHEMIKSKPLTAYASWVRRMSLVAMPTRESHETIIDPCFIFEGKQYVLVIAPMLAHGKVTGFLAVVTSAEDERSASEWNQLRVTARVLGMALQASIEYQTAKAPDLRAMRLKALTSTLPGSSVTLDEEGRIIEYYAGKKNVPHIIKLSNEWAFRFSNDEQKREHEKSLKTAFSGQSAKCRIYIQGEKNLLMEHSFEAVRFNDFSKVKEVVCFIRDITDVFRLQAIIRSLKEKDPSTGCLTLHGMTENAPKEIDRSRSSRLQCVIMSLELENEGPELQLSGSSEIDEFLNGLVSRMKSLLPARHLIARRGEYSFVLLTTLGKSDPSPTELAANLLKGMKQPILVGRSVHVMSAAIGHSSFPGNGDSFQTLLNGADIAAIHAHRSGRNRALAFHQDMARDALDRSQLEARLHQAVDNEEFTLFFQPKIRLFDNSVSGVEALLRWGGKDAISPAKFIPIAEECGLISYIGEWVLRRACCTAKRWSDEGYTIPISVNVSTRQFHDNDFHTIVKEVLADSGCNPSLIELEITEGAMFSDPSAAIESFRKLKSMGVGISIDDFGMGFSSLSYLKNLPADAVKIDRTFITGIPEESDNLAITKAIIAMAKAMDLRVIAEGVEDLKCLDHLRTLNCDEVQGFYFSKALPDQELIDWYRAYRYVMT